jgi:RHS repeat-associated protein
LEPETWRLVKDLRFVYDGWNMIAELDHSFATGPGLTGSRVNRTFLWGEDLSGTMTGAGGVGGLLSTTYQGTTYHVCSDANGNVTGLVPTSGPQAGQLIARFDYDPFGNRITNTGPDVDLCPFGFSSKYTDSETGLVDFGLRIYSPTLGRWPSRDPIEEQGGINLYGMVGNDPVNRWDYLGLRELTFAESLVKQRLEQTITEADRYIAAHPDTSDDVKARKVLFIRAIRNVLSDYLSTIAALPQNSAGTASFRVGNGALTTWASRVSADQFTPTPKPTCNVFVAHALSMAHLPVPKSDFNSGKGPARASEWQDPSRTTGGMDQYKVVYQVNVASLKEKGTSLNDKATQIEIELKGAFGNVLAGAGHCGICLGHGVYVSSTASTGNGTQPFNDQNEVFIKPIPGTSLRPKDTMNVIIRGVVEDAQTK